MPPRALDGAYLGAKAGERRAAAESGLIGVVHPRAITISCAMVAVSNRLVNRRVARDIVGRDAAHGLVVPHIVSARCLCLLGQGNQARDLRQLRIPQTACIRRPRLGTWNLS